MKTGDIIYIVVTFILIVAALVIGIYALDRYDYACKDFVCNASNACVDENCSAEYEMCCPSDEVI